MSKILSAAFLFGAGFMANFGYQRSPDELLAMMGIPFFGILAGVGFLALAGILFLFVFWLWMLIDCLRRDFKNDVEKIVWVLVLVFLHLLGAIIYYFVVKISNKTAKGKKK